MNLRRTWAMARKELRHILRDTRSLLIALAQPVIMILLFGYALSLDVNQIPTLIFDSDGSPASRALIARFEGSRYFEILGFVDDYRTLCVAPPPVMRVVFEQVRDLSRAG